jgi:hypothetical protein
MILSSTISASLSPGRQRTLYVLSCQLPGGPPILAVELREEIGGTSFRAQRLCPATLQGLPEREVDALPA